MSNLIDSFFDAEGVAWRVSFDYEKHTVRKGNFSPVASDPEEYFGVHRYELTEIHWLETEEDENGEFQLIEDNIPDWAYEMVQEDLEEWS